MALDTSFKKTIRQIGDAKEARILTLGLMVLCLVMVIISVVVSVYFEPRRVAEREFKKLVTNYYEKFYYPQFMDAIDETIFDERMEFYHQYGLQDVKLRQVLLYNKGMNRGYEKYFSRKDFQCNKDRTYAKIFPEQPYGVKDYRVEYFYECKDPRKKEEKTEEVE